MTIDQVIIESAMEEQLAKEHGVFVQYSTECLRLDVEDGKEHTAKDYPVTLATRQSNAEHNDQLRYLQARYLVGADGSRSWTRNQVGIQMQGARSSMSLLTMFEIQFWSDIVLRSTVLGSGRHCPIN